VSAIESAAFARATQVLGSVPPCEHVWWLEALGFRWHRTRGCTYSIATRQATIGLMRAAHF